MIKNFVLDTNVLLHDPNSLFSFDDNHIFIPISVLEEIDNFKKELSELGRNARAVVRHLDTLREAGSLADGVALPNGGHLTVAIAQATLSQSGLPHQVSIARTVDALIIATAMEIRDAHPGVATILVSKDVNLRIRADALGIQAVNYDTERIDIEELYPGYAEVETSGEAVDAFYREGRAPIPPADALPGGGPAGSQKFVANEFITLRDRAAASHTALTRVDEEQGLLRPIRRLRDPVFGIKPRNREQAFALDLLLDDNIKLVTLVGKAGTGKTLIAIAAGLHKSAEDTVYQRLLVSRPIFPLGKDIGYLPGDLEDKLNPWMQPIFDNVELIMGLGQTDKKKGRSYRELIDLGMLAIEPLTYIRGRSIPNQYMIVDEAQNLTPHEIKTILTRAGEGTKIVLTGDPYQIDNPYVDSTNNGLTHAVNRFQGSRLFGHVTLVKGERSELAELASNVL
jgi:PhoH-like ATPase